MALRSQQTGNYNPSTGTTLVSGKNRDYHSAKSGRGFMPVIITPAGITAEPGNGYKYHVYLSPATIEVVNGPIVVEYLVVGGGGAAGGHWSPTPSAGSLGTGGGGAGGMRSGTLEINSGPLPISIGNGGTGGEFNGGNGGNSNLGSITSQGGGGGGMAYWFNPTTGVGPPLFWCQGRPGGSGGGGGTTPSSYPGPNAWYTGGTGNDPPTTPPQGNPGGNSFPGNGGGGGGGAGGSGATAPSGTAGIGRTDIRFAAPLIAPAIPAPLRPTWTTLVGDNGTYASGGRGNLSISPQGNLPGGGGAGGGAPGYSYTGGGGSGYGFRSGPHGGFPGGNGGSGIVIFRYLNS